MKLYEAKNIITEVFENPFDKDKFSYFIRNLLKNLHPAEFGIRSGNIIPPEFRDFIASYERIGKYEDEEGYELDVLLVKLKREHSIDYARSTQRNFIRWYLKRKERDAALVAFHTEKSSEWRFSFIKMQYSLEKKADELTPAKRSSFMVGESGKSHTAQRQLIDLLKNDHAPCLSDIEDAFSIEAVSDEFYEKYKSLLFNLVDEIKKIVEKDSSVREEFESKNISILNFSKKLLGQIVFLYFLQKKGWLGIDEKEKYGEGDKNFLRSLFNKTKPDENFFNDYLEYLFYDALSKKRVTDYYERFKTRIPFLNGGLFDPIEFYDWQKTDIVIPNEIFSTIVPQASSLGETKSTPASSLGETKSTSASSLGETKSTSASSLGETKSTPASSLGETKSTPASGLGKPKSSTTTSLRENEEAYGILDVFDLYNFTVKEDEPLETEVAIDPEMLGKVFERMLDVTERKSKGAFYTPREIVHYMAQQSLLYYLVSQASSLRISNQDDWKTDLETFIHYGEHIIDKDIAVAEGKLKNTAKNQKIPDSIKQHADAIDQALENIKICDPAVGSGAFPVGIMNEIVKLRKLLTPFIVSQTSSLSLSENSSTSSLSENSSTSSLSENPPSPSLSENPPSPSLSENPSTLRDDDFDIIYFDKNAETEIHERDLPHWCQKGVAYFVTFRLGDSIPDNAKNKIKNERENWLNKYKIRDASELKKLPKQARIEYHKLFSKRYDELLDSGYGSCILANPEIKEIVENALKYFDGKRYFLDEFIVMPNHVHVIVVPKENWTLDKITHSWKSFTANEINKFTGNSGQVWMHESFDHIIRSEKQLHKIRQYIKDNPKVPQTSSLRNGSSKDQQTSSLRNVPKVPQTSSLRSKHQPSNLSKAQAGSLRNSERSAYRFKSNAIQNSIYGVDIDAGAVEIAKLRLWLSMVVDEERIDTIEPLPNLEYKIVQGNSLINIPDGTAINDALATEIENLTTAYFHITDKEKKQEQKQIIDNKIQEQLQFVSEMVGYKIDFDFKLFFHEVWKEKDGFDVVIGNPPYVVDRKLSEIEKNYFKKNYKSAIYQINLYLLFIEKGFHVLNRKGHLSLIVPNTWLINKVVSKFREYLLKEYYLIEIADLTKDEIFDATVLPVIFIGSNRKINNYEIQINNGKESFFSFRTKIPKGLILKEDNSIINYQIKSSELSLINKIDKGTMNLGKLSLISFGVKFYQVGKGKPKQTRNDVDNHVYTHSTKINNNCKKILEGKNIGKYKISFKGKYIEYGEWLAEPRKPEMFEGERILLRRIVGEKGFIATYVKDNWCNNSLLHVIKVNSKESSRYILSLINSELIGWYFLKKFARFEKTFPEVRVHEVNRLPIKTYVNKKLFEIIVDYILFLKTQPTDKISFYFEQLLDGMVYELYFENEIKQAGCDILKYLDDLPEISDEMQVDEKIKIITKVFNKLYDAASPVRKNLEAMEQVEEVRIIKESLEK